MGNLNSKNHTGHNSRKNVMRNKTKGINYSCNLIGSNTAELCTELTAFTRHMDGSSFYYKWEINNILEPVLGGLLATVQNIVTSHK